MISKDQSEGQLEKLREMIDGIETAMLTTVDLHGRLRSRPMASIEMDHTGVLWFFTNEFSGKSHEVIQNNHVNLSYIHPGKGSYVSISGEAELVTDNTKMKQLWKPSLKAWFPEGLDDPRLALLKVNVSIAEYWDASSGQMMKLYHIAKAIIKGEKYTEGTHDR